MGAGSGGAEPGRAGGERLEGVAGQRRRGTAGSGAVRRKGQELHRPPGRAQPHRYELAVAMAETMDVCKRDFAAMDGLMARYPEFGFSQSQAATYRVIEQEQPALFERMRARIASGQWDVTANTWVEGDLNTGVRRGAGAPIAARPALSR